MQEDKKVQFTIGENEYELKYSLKRLEVIEANTKESTMGALIRGNGTLSIPSLKLYLGSGLKEVGNDSFVPFKKGQEYAEALIVSEGYLKVNMAVVAQLQEDCGFLFPKDL